MSAETEPNHIDAVEVPVANLMVDGVIEEGQATIEKVEAQIYRGKGGNG